MSTAQTRFLGVTGEIESRGELEIFHLDTEEDSNGALVHTVDDVVETWTRERRPLAAGGFGVAWLEKTTTGRVRVVKEVKKIVNGDVMTEYWLRELSAMALLHRNTKYFPKFYGWFHDKDYVYIAMEHVDQGDLTNCVTHPLPEPQSQSIVGQVAQALKILHKKGITHRDLKPANILVRQGPTPSWRVVVADFGISKRVRNLSTSLYSSFGGDYMAPEILGFSNSDQYTNAVDMWSLGCLAYWLLTMNMPVPTSKMLSYCRRPWAEAVESIDMTGIDEVGRDFILSLINPKPENRMNADDACKHAWISEFSFTPAVTSSRPGKHDVVVARHKQTITRESLPNIGHRTSRREGPGYSSVRLATTEAVADSNLDPGDRSSPRPPSKIKSASTNGYQVRRDEDELRKRKMQMAAASTSQPPPRADRARTTTVASGSKANEEDGTQENSNRQSVPRPKLDMAPIHPNLVPKTQKIVSRASLSKDLHTDSLGSEGGSDEIEDVTPEPPLNVTYVPGSFNWGFGGATTNAKNTPGKRNPGIKKEVKTPTSRSARVPAAIPLSNEDGVILARLESPPPLLAVTESISYNELSPRNGSPELHHVPRPKVTGQRSSNTDTDYVPHLSRVASSQNSDNESPPDDFVPTQKTRRTKKRSSKEKASKEDSKTESFLNIFGLGLKKNRGR